MKENGNKLREIKNKRNNSLLLNLKTNHRSLEHFIIKTLKNSKFE